MKVNKSRITEYSELKDWKRFVQIDWKIYTYLDENDNIINSKKLFKEAYNFSENRAIVSVNWYYFTFIDENLNVIKDEKEIKIMEA